MGQETGGTGMLAADDRARAIVELVRREGFQAIDGLAGRFGVTPQTIRRDVNLLCDRGLLRRRLLRRWRLRRWLLLGVRRAEPEGGREKRAAGDAETRTDTLAEMGADRQTGRAHACPHTSTADRRGISRRAPPASGFACSAR